GLLVRVDEADLHVARRGILVALEQALELRVLPALDEAGHREVLLEGLDHLLRLRREGVDARLGQVPAMVAARGDVIAAHHQQDEEERVDEGAGAVARRALAEEAPELLEAEGQVGEQEPPARDQVQHDVGVVQGPLDDERTHEAEGQEEEPEEAEERARAAHGYLQRTDSTERSVRKRPIRRRVAKETGSLV